MVRKILMDKSLLDSWHILEIRTIAEIEEIRPIWEAMQAAEPHPAINVDIDRYLSVVQAADHECRPLILLLRHNDQPRAMVIGRRERHAIPVRVGYKTLVKPRLRCMTVVYGGVLGQPDEQVSSLLVCELMKILRRREVNVIFFNHLRVDSPFYTQVRRIPDFLCRNPFPLFEPHWRMSIPRDVDGFYQLLSKKHRANLRRSVRRFEEKWKNQFQIVHYHRQNDVGCLSQHVEEISRKTYQHALSAGFSNDSLFNSILNTDAIHGRLFMSILYVQNQPCVFQWGTVFKEMYFLEKIGYDPQWTRYGIGNILFIKVLEKLCLDDSLKYIDFGFGDAGYKRSYGNECSQAAAATYLFAPRIYPRLINLLNGLNSGITHGLVWLLHKTKMFAWVKRVWRRKLQKAHGSRRTEGSSKD